MPVPQSYHRVIPVEISAKDEYNDEELDLNANKPPRGPVYTARFEGGGRYTSGVEAFLNHDLGPRRKTSCPGLSGSGYHRSRDRTRQSAVQRLVERKLVQKEKEREKERDRSIGSSTAFSSRQSFHSYSPNRTRDSSGSRSENGFMLGAGRSSSPSKENLEPSEWINRSRRGARSVSGTRLRSDSQEPTTKTYITIGPGKPTRIREHSPAKSAKLSPEETVTSARERFAATSRSSSPLKTFDLNRQSSPSPHRKTSRKQTPPSYNNSNSNNKSKDILRDASPLKSADILKTFRASKSESNFSSLNENVEPSATPFFSSERVFSVNNNNNNNSSSVKKPPSRRLSADILNSVNSNGGVERASPESETSSLSSSASSVSSAAGSSVSDKAPSVLSQRRISLEQRFQARTATARFSSPDRTRESRHSFTQATAFQASTKVDDTWTEIKIRRYSTVKTHCEFSAVSGGGGTGGVKSRPVPASRKISLPAARRPEPAPRRRSSLTTILAPERFA